MNFFFIGSYEVEVEFEEYKMWYILYILECPVTFWVLILVYYEEITPYATYKLCM